MRQIAPLKQKNSLFFWVNNVGAATTIGVATFFGTQGQILPTLGVAGIAGISGFSTSYYLSHKKRQIGSDKIILNQFIIKTEKIDNLILFLYKKFEN